MLSHLVCDTLKCFANSSTRISSHFLHYDVVIAGGGVMGSSTAYFLKQKDPRMSIAVIERDFTYSLSSSGRSLSSIRQQFSTVENIYLSQWSFAFMTQLSKLLMVDENDPPGIQLFRSAYVFLSTHGGYDILKRNCEVQASCGVDVKFLTPKQLQQRFDWLIIDGLSAGSTCDDKCEGWFDGWSLLFAFQKKALDLGVDYINAACEILDIESKVNSVKIKTPVGDKNINCSYFVNAAGPWAGELMEKNGIYLPVYPRKRYVYVIDCPKGPGRNMPLMIDPSGVFCRPEGHGTMYVCGNSPVEEEEPDASNLDVDYDYFEDNIWPNLAERYHGMEELKLRHAWAGYYDFNTLDQNGIIGGHPHIENLYFVNGFSGHGIQQSPAAGNSISELILDGCFTSIDLTKLGYERVLSNSPVKEVNVV